MRIVGTRSALYVLSTAVQKFSALLLLPIYTRLLSPAEYGLVGVLSTAFALALSVVMLGLDHGIVRACSTSRGMDSQAPGSTVSLASRFSSAVALAGCASLGVALLLAAGGPFVLPTLFPGTQPSDAIAWVLVALVSQAVMYCVLALMQARERAGWFAALSIGYFVTFAVSSVLGILVSRDGLASVSIALALSGALFAAIGLVVSGKWGYLTTRVSTASVKSLLAYSLPMMPHTLTLQGSALALRLVAVHLISAVAAGVFTIAMYAVSVIDAVQTGLYRALAPWYFSLRDRAPESMTQQVRHRIVQMIAVNAVVVSAVALFAAPAVAWVLPRAFADSILLVPLLAFSMLVKGLYYPKLAVLMEAPRGPRRVLMVSLTSTALAIGAAVPLVAALGLMGLAWSQLALRAMMALGVHFAARSLDDIPFPWRKVLAVQLPALVAVAVSAILGPDTVGEFDALGGIIVPIVTFLAVGALIFLGTSGGRGRVSAKWRTR